MNEEPEVALSDELAPRRRRLPTKRDCGLVGVVAFVVDVGLTRWSGATWGRSIGAGLFLGLFTGYGLWVVSKARRALRPEADDPALRDPSAPPPPGGWASPTRGQNVLGRLSRSVGGLRRNRRPPPRR